MTLQQNIGRVNPNYRKCPSENQLKMDFSGISTRLWVSGMGRPFQLSTFIMDIFLEPPASWERNFFPNTKKNNVSFKTKTIASKMRLLHVVSCWVCLEFLWLTFAHTPRYPHQWLQLNDSLPSAGQGGHTSSGTKQQTLQLPGSYPFSRWVCLKNNIAPLKYNHFPLNYWTMKNGRKSNPSKWVHASQTADPFFCGS